VTIISIIHARKCCRCPLSMRGRVHVMARRPSVRPSHQSTAAARAADMRTGDIDRCCCGRRHHVPAISCRRLRSAANAGSVMLRAEGRGSTQTFFTTSLVFYIAECQYWVGSCFKNRSMSNLWSSAPCDLTIIITITQCSVVKTD